MFVLKCALCHFSAFGQLYLTCPLFILIYPLDHVFEQILHSSSSELGEARQILRNIIRRRLYKCLGQTQPKESVKVTQVCVCVLLCLYCNAHTLYTASMLVLVDQL